MRPILSYIFFYRKYFFLLSITFFSLSNIYAQPSNDNCSNYITLTSNTSCNNNQYTVRNATASSGIPAGCAPGGTKYDVWFRFTAVGTTHTITLSNRGSNFTNPAIQIFSGTCGSLTSLACGTTSLTSTSLTNGTIYYVRISNVGAFVGSNGTFDICITHPQPPPANDNCSGATTLTSSVNCNNVTANIRYATSATPAGTCGGATATTTYDVWFRFQATATNQTVALSNLGTRLTTATTYVEVLSGACGSLTSLGCQNVTTRLTVSGLTIGVFYYVRVYVLLSPTATATADWNFNICVRTPPTNDECAGAISLTSSATCNNTAGTLDLATPNAAMPLGCFAAGTYYDVWYSFVATSTSQTITLSNTGANFTAPRIQLYSGACAGLTSIVCASATTLTRAGLTIGVTYYVRIANFNANPSGTGTVANFNICVTANPTAPANDDCSGAILLNSETTCSNVAGTLIRALPTAGLAACGNALSAEVWYSFVAETAYPIITLSSVGASFSAAGPRIQLFSGACGSLSSLACVSTLSLNTFTTPGGAGLTVGNTYYVRITTNSNTGSPTSGTWTFNICITDPMGAGLDYAKSYINVTGGTNGRTVQPGDVLEFRSVLVVTRGGSPLALRTIDSVGYYDTLLAGSGLSLVPNSIALRTNEGTIYKSFTDVFDADAGWSAPVAGGTGIRINLGTGNTASNFVRGKLRSNSRPSFYNNTFIILATFRVTVTAGFGSLINFGGGAFRFRDSTTGVYSTINFPADYIMVYQSPTACPDGIMSSNILGDEDNGTFGVPTGSPAYPQNRGTSPNTNYIYAPFGANAPQDYYYGIANNTSAAGSTNQLLPKTNAARVFGHWDISGDHTGAANTAKGNLPCDNNSPISATNPCGYMLVINSAYRTDVAFEFVVSGVCPDTYYEISGWFKNICYRCGCDSTGLGSGSVGYIPSAPGDSSGVRPNIAIEINGVDYYTTGDLRYQGLGGTQSGSDTLNNWVQRSFVYRTGSSESNFTISFRNNAPGGGGNDWALDDISLRTCNPEIVLSPGPNPVVCNNNTVDIGATVVSYFSSYAYSQWEVSTNNGSTWSPLGSIIGPTSPTWNGTAWQYDLAYPTFMVSTADSGKQYRVVLASTSGSISNAGCRYAEGTNNIVLSVDPCTPILRNGIPLLKGKNINNNALLEWINTKEEGLVKYELQKSQDGITYETIDIRDGHKNPLAERNNYSYPDPVPLKDATWYRVKVTYNLNNIKFSNIIKLVGANTGIVMQSLVNPFNSEIKFEIVSAYDREVTTELLDHTGKKLKSQVSSARKGVNNIMLNNTTSLIPGFYILRVSSGNTVLHRKLIKSKLY